MYDKSGLGYNQNNLEMGSSSKIIENDNRSHAEIVKESGKKKGSEPLKEDMQKPEMKRNEEVKCTWRKSSTTHNNYVRRPKTTRRPPIPRYHNFFLGLCYA